MFHSLPPCENLRRKHHFRIELCLRLSILRLFHVGYVVEKCPFTWLTLMVSMQRQRTKDFLLQARVEALSSGPQIWQFLVVVLLSTPKRNVLKCTCSTFQYHWFLAFSLLFPLSFSFHLTNEFKLLRRQRRWQVRHEFTYLTVTNGSFARHAPAHFICVPFSVVVVLSTTWNDLCYCCGDDVSIWRHVFSLVFFFSLFVQNVHTNLILF